MTEDNNKVTIILAIGLIGVAIGLLYLLKINMNKNTTPTLNTLQTQEPTQLETLYMQKLESRLNDKSLNTTLPQLHL